MKLHVPLIVASLVASLSAADVPKVFAGLFEQNIPVKGQIGMVMPPKEIDKYAAKVEEAARKDLKWFREFSSQAKPGAPLPYDPRLGLTKEEYNEYRSLWTQRKFKVAEEVMILLRQSPGGAWTITCTGSASPISTLRYQANDDTFRSPNGELKRSDDVKEGVESILGEWNGQEWKFEDNTSLGKTRESIALGRLADQKSAILIYRIQELSTSGARLLDKSLVVRFTLGKAGQMKARSAATPTPSAPDATATPEAAAKKPSRPAGRN